MLLETGSTLKMRDDNGGGKSRDGDGWDSNGKVACK